jgi:hypothetical protein
MALVIVASATAATGTPAATRTPTAAGTSATRPATRTAAIGFGTGFVDIQRPPAYFFSIQRRDGFFGFAGVGHFYECKSSGTAGVTIGDYADLVDFAVGFEQSPQLGFRGAVREIANKKLLHGFPFSVSQRETSVFVGGFG